MAQAITSSFPAVVTPALTDAFPIVQAGVDYKETLQQVLDLFNANIQLPSTAKVTGLDAALAALLPKSGGTMTGNLILNADPGSALQAATKQYVDSLVAATGAGLSPRATCRAATTTNLVGTYNNGTAGLGATLTFAGAVNSVDNVTLNNGDRIAVWLQIDGIQNGLYVRTSSTVWTRATDYDNSPNGEVTAGTYTIIMEGDTNANKMLMMVTAGTIIIGTSLLAFENFPLVAAGAGISVSGNLISLADTIQVNEITEFQANQGVTIEGVLLKDETIIYDGTIRNVANTYSYNLTLGIASFLSLTTDEIREYTLGQGVVVEDIILKDGTLGYSASAYLVNLITGVAQFGVIESDSYIRVPNAGLRAIGNTGVGTLAFKPGSTLTTDRQLSILTGDSNRSLIINTEDVSIVSTSQNVDFTGPFATHAKAVTLAKSGRLVTIMFAGPFAEADGSGGLITSTALLSGYRPVLDFKEIIPVYTGSSNATGEISIDTNGIITISAGLGSAGFNITGNVGVPAGVSVSYLIA